MKVHVTQDQLLELQQLVEEKQLRKVRQRSHQHLESVLSQFENLAKKWIYEYSNLPSCTSEKSLEKRVQQCVKILILEGITSEEDLVSNIPKCRYCKKNAKLVVPTSRLTELELTEHCGAKKCKNLYTYDKTKESIQEIYGVDNISKLDDIQKKKEETFLKKYGVKHLQQSPEIRKKSKETVKKKYGVENISQLEDIKRKKAQTFKKHYGVSNIFKRMDLMRIYWKEKLGVSNPIFHSDMWNEWFYRKKVIDINGEKHIVLSDLEYNVIKVLFENIGNTAYLKDLKVKVNEDIFVKLYKEKDLVRSYIPDIHIGDKYPIEIKQGSVSDCYEELEKAFDLSMVYDRNFIAIIDDERRTIVCYCLYKASYVLVQFFVKNYNYRYRSELNRLISLFKRPVRESILTTTSVDYPVKIMLITLDEHFKKYPDDYRDEKIKKYFENLNKFSVEYGKKIASNKNDSESDNLIPDSHELAKILGVKV